MSHNYKEQNIIKKKATIEFLKQRGHRLIGYQWSNSYQDHICKIECKKGHKFEYKFEEMKNNDAKCPNCNDTMSGGWGSIIKNFAKITENVSSAISKSLD